MKWSRIKLMVTWSLMTVAFMLSSAVAFADGNEWG